MVLMYNAKTCVTDAADTQRRRVFETVWEERCWSHQKGP